ncbi:MAG: zf-HC2 domain-containing protein [Thermoanaerobaculia bacterium]|nr:zf-HC2 domain-containing protein [Thermoanaerobaculia bacterium]
MTPSTLRPPCPDWEPRILAALDGVPSAEEMAALDRHCESCPSCSSFESSLVASLERIDRELEVELALGSDVYSRILPQLDAIDAERARESRWILARPSTVLFASVLVLGVGLAIGWFLRPTVSPADPRVVDQEFHQLVEDALPLILAVGNHDGEEVLLTSLERQSTRDRLALLVEDAEALAIERSRIGDRRRARLASDLVEVLRQLAAASTGDQGGLRAARQTLEGRAVLFQVSADSVRTY